MSINFTKNGILNGKIVEPFLTLPDNSYWQLLLFHYVDGGNNLFTQENAANCNEFGLFSRLKWIDDFKYNNQYQFYVIQDGVEHRWIQKSKPTAASPTGITVITGHPVHVLGKTPSQQSSYLGYSTWWGACGSWTNYTVQGKTGIPGFGPTNKQGICAEYLMLYARINNPKIFLQREEIENCFSINEF